MKVLLTPTPDFRRQYCGGLTPQAIEHQALKTLRQVAAIIEGEAPVGANTEHWTRRP